MPTHPATIAPQTLTEKTAQKFAPAPKHGGARLPISKGSHGGGKKGRSGRKPNEFKRRMQLLVANVGTHRELAKILKSAEHPHFLAAYKMAAEFGHGKAVQAIEHHGEDGGPLAIEITHEIVDARAD